MGLQWMPLARDYAVHAMHIDAEDSVARSDYLRPETAAVLSPQHGRLILGNAAYVGWMSTSLTPRLLVSGREDQRLRGYILGVLLVLNQRRPRHWLRPRLWSVSRKECRLVLQGAVSMAGLCDVT